MKLHKRNAPALRRYKPFFYNRYLSIENGWKWLALHPLDTVTSAVECVVSAWHRAKWGWDVSDVWGLNTHLALIMPPMLRSLKDGASYSSYIHLGGKVYEDPTGGEELYRATLESCAQAFENYYQIHHEDDEWSTEKYRQAFLGVQIAFAILGENYGTLWD